MIDILLCKVPSSYANLLQMGICSLLCFHSMKGSLISVLNRPSGLELELCKAGNISVEEDYIRLRNRDMFK